MFYFDTYAFIEIINGSESYLPYEEVLGVTTIFNLAELNWCLKKKVSESIADELTEKYKGLLVEVTVNDVKRAMSFRRMHKGISIPDAIGYTVAKKMNVKFLTGDEGFKDSEKEQ